MIKITLCILSLIVLFCQKTKAQNLVPDWSFEYKKNWGCLQNDSLQWFDPYFGFRVGKEAADYEGCRGKNCAECTPYNDYGYQVPRLGLNYNALVNSYIPDFFVFDTAYRDYFEIKL